jgi:adenylate cyclase class 2
MAISTGHEIEVKLRCDSVAALEHAGIKLTLECARHFEENWLFDTPDHQLGSGLAVLRVRAMEGAGLLTYKAPPPAGSPISQFKKRIEIETTIGDPERMVAILTHMGYRKWFHYQKYRTVYDALLPNGAGLQVMFDETPIGSFLELEGEEEAIAEAMQLLGARRDEQILLSYLALQAERCSHEGRPFEDLVFDPIVG